MRYMALHHLCKLKRYAHKTILYILQEHIHTTYILSTLEQLSTGGRERPWLSRICIYLYIHRLCLCVCVTILSNYKASSIKWLLLEALILLGTIQISSFSFFLVSFFFLRILIMLPHYTWWPCLLSCFLVLTVSQIFPVSNDLNSFEDY